MSASLSASQARSQALCEQAPEQFLNLLNVLAAGADNAIPICERVMTSLDRDRSDWTGTAYACYAHCLKESKRYREALLAAEKARQLRLNLIGEWYYHDAVVSCYNFLDDMANALEAADAAIRFYRNEQDFDNESDHLSRKANILKQIASPLSYHEQSRVAAKNFILQAIHSICSAIAITKYWQDLEEELSAIARIAARTDIEAEDLRSLREMGPQVTLIVERYFTLPKLRGTGASEYFNRSIEARKKGNREDAAVLLKRALDLAPEESEEDRCFKAFLAYQHGVNLLKLNNLENHHPLLPYPAGQLGVVREIRDAWNTCLRLYSTVSENHLQDFNRRFANLTHAKQAILGDRLMSV